MPALQPDVLLGVALGAICSRNRYTANPAPVIAELRARAGARTDIVAMEAGMWAGYYDDEHTAVLVVAILAEIPDAARWAEVGRSQRSRPAHGTGGFGPAYVPPVCGACGETVGRCAQKLGRGEGRCCDDCTHGSR